MLSNSRIGAIMNDPELQNLIEAENQHYLNTIDLIGASNAPTSFIRGNSDWGVAQFRSAGGYAGKRPYAGTSIFDEIELLAAQRGCDAFHAEHCNVQPASGSLANLSVYKSMLRPGDTILSMEMKSGGHLSHGHKSHIIRDLYQIVEYQVDPNTYLLDYSDILKIARSCKPTLIIAGSSTYTRTIDFSIFKAIGDEVGAKVMADISHTSGLVATGNHPNPCDSGLIVTSSIEKTLRGTRGGFILSPKELAQKIDHGVFPGVQSSVGLDGIVAKAKLFLEVQSPEFHEYIQKVIHFANLMVTVFFQNHLAVLYGGTDTHLIILDMRPQGLTGREAEKRLEDIGILSNRNVIPFDSLPPFESSGLRLGTSAITARGYEEDEIIQVAEWVSAALKSTEWHGKLEKELQQKVSRMVARRRESDSLNDLL